MSESVRDGKDTVGGGLRVQATDLPRRTVWYTRCPVPTASGLAYQLRLFDEAFADTGFAVRNIKELGRERANTHFDHVLKDSFREGGGSPPVWARARGADTALLGITFVEETLGLFVRRDDPCLSVTDLAGRRLALPVWPDLVFNFFRFAAQKAFVSALQLHDMGAADVRFTDVVETGDHHQLINPGFADRRERSIPSYYRCQLTALLDGRVDAIFAKGAEIATMKHEALEHGSGGVRLLYDLMQAEPLWAKVNNATPRLLTVSNSLVREHPDVVVRYLRTLLQAARWAEAETNRAGAAELMARETGVTAADIRAYYTPDIYVKLRPGLDYRLLETLEVMKLFLHDHGYIEHDFSTEAWIARAPLEEAYAREDMAVQCGTEPLARVKA